LKGNHMNIIETIKDLLGGEVIARLSSLTGVSEDQIRSLANAAVPGLLSGLSTVASTSDGADRLANTLKQVEPPPEGGFGSVLAGQAGPLLEKGLSLLTALVGSGALPAIIAALAKHAAVDSGKTKSLLGYLAPLVLSAIAGHFKGKSLTGPALSSFFAEQKSNISSALPQGFSLAGIPGLGGAVGAARAAAAPAQEGASGLPPWLLPVAGLVLLAGIAWYFMGQPTQEPAPAEGGARPAAIASPDPTIRAAAKIAAKGVEAAGAVLPDPTKLVTDLNSIFTSATEDLKDVKDVATADTALPKLTELSSKIEGIKALWDKLPEAGKATVAKVVTDHLATFKDLVDKVLGISGVGDKLKPILDTIVTKLSGFKV
jgi:hypothetical protein